ncbi:LPXTG cell wall anchor domain-containing protein [Paenibacillus mucilaginosus]|nr:LPXTG cell wall anchor domain-containing protein [Paenibacillus mucilaginosus]
MSGMFSSPALAAVILGLVLLAAVLFALHRRRKNTNPRFGQRNAKSPGRQSCSYCRRKVPSKELTFYAGPGNVVGVCRQCKPQAERQALMRL